MTPIEAVLTQARTLVKRGFVRDRECHSAETTDRMLVSFTDEDAYYFTPTAAIFLVARTVQGTRRTSKNVGDETLKLLNESGYSMERYRNEKKIRDVLAIFDKAIDSIRRSERRERKAVVISLDDVRKERPPANRRMLRRRTFP